LAAQPITSTPLWLSKRVANVSGHDAVVVDKLAQTLLGDAELFGPVGKLVLLVEVDPQSVLRAFYVRMSAMNHLLGCWMRRGWS
jgi:hypothetical protein